MLLIYQYELLGHPQSMAILDDALVVYFGLRAFRVDEATRFGSLAGIGAMQCGSSRLVKMRIRVGDDDDERKTIRRKSPFRQT